ncbi:nuclear transport factor 2 family protein [soil metagenome]
MTNAPPAVDPVVAEQIGARLFAAIEAGDVDTVRELYAPDAVVWHNHDRVEQPAPDNLRVLRWVHRHISGLRYEQVRRQATPNGFVQQHILRGDGPGGPIDVPACLVVSIADARITRIDEYLDPAAVTSLAR